MCFNMPACVASQLKHQVWVHNNDNCHLCTLQGEVVEWLNNRGRGVTKQVVLDA